MTQEMTPTRRALAAVLGGRTDYVPPANPLAQTTKDLMEFCRATWPKAHRDPVMMADLAAAPYEVCGIGAARPQFDNRWRRRCSDAGWIGTSRTDPR